jgi:Tol biopolymer transport system component
MDRLDRLGNAVNRCGSGCHLYRSERHIRLLRATLSIAAGLALAEPLYAQSAGRAPTGAELLLQETPSVWFEEYFSTLEASPDGRRALYASPFAGRIRLLDLGAGRKLQTVSRPGITDLRRATFARGGSLAVFGTSGGHAGWYAEEDSKLVRLQLPATARHVSWSPDGRRLAFAQHGTEDSVHVGPMDRLRAYAVLGTVTGLSWLPDGRALLVLALNAGGSSTLSRIEPATGRTSVVARDLDAPTFTSPVPVAADGLHAYVALATAAAPDPEARHEPHADRQLGIYEVALADGSRRPVVRAAQGADAYAPSVAAGHLYWIQATTEASIVVLPIDGGHAGVIARNAMVPSWRPDGREVGFVSGEWRWADWALNWDGYAVDLDVSGRVIGNPKPVIVGYHEDFQPVWSPRGQWIAYHSHRSKTPLATYAGDAQADDIWLRRVDAPPRDPGEIRLTDFGIEANSPDWSRDGTRLIFTSWSKEGPPGVSYPYVVTIDTTTGHVIGHEQLQLPKEIQNTAWVAYSPVSDDVAIEADQGNGRHALWIVATTGAGARRLVEYPLGTFGGVSWTPDGRTLIYAELAGDRMQLFAVPAAGGTPRQLTHDAANLFTPRVSPDGRFIAATRIAHWKQIWWMPLPK